MKTDLPSGTLWLLESSLRRRSHPYWLAMRPAILLLSALVFAVMSDGPAGAETKPGDVSITTFRTGVKVFDRGEWSVVGVRAMNHGDSDTNVAVRLHLDGDTQTQYEAKFWVPARCTRVTWLPVRTPPRTSRRQSLQAFTLNLVEIDGTMTVQAGTDLGKFTQMPVPVSILPTQTGTIHRRRDPRAASVAASEKTHDQDAIDLVGIMRESLGSDPTRINMQEALLPPYPYAYDGLDSLVIGSDRWLDDSASPLAIRSWLARGGRVWVLLDKVSQRTLDVLLGNDVCCEIVDRVELTQFSIETPELVYLDLDLQEPWESERPVEFVRVLATDDAIVHSSIDGWPAALSIKQGTGEVFITTLAPRGWHYEVGQFEDPPAAGVPTSGTTGALREIGGQILSKPPDAQLSREHIEPLLRSQLGHQVPSRSLVSAVLGANGIVLLCAGIGLARWNRLEHLVWLVPATVLATTLVLVAVGRASNVRVPATVASVQLLEVASGSNQVQATTFATLYSPDGETFPLSAGSGGLITPDTSVGELKRTTWDGIHHSYWDKFQVSPGGPRFVEIRDNYVLPGAVRARGVFGPAGLTGQLEGIEFIGTTEDPVVGAPVTSNSAVELDDDGAFRCGVGDLLAPGEYMRGTLLSDTQQRRLAIYRSLLDESGDAPYPARFSLFVWGDPAPIGVDVPEVFQPRGASLWAVPLRLQRTPSQSPFVVPATFMRMLNSRGQFGTSNAYNPRTGKWIQGATSATRSVFRFTLPPQVMPCTLQAARVTLKIQAPSREVELLGVDASTSQLVTIERWQSPSGVLSIAIDDPAVLDVMQADGLLLGLSVGEVLGDQPPAAGNDGLQAADTQTNNNTWQAEYLRVSVSGTTQ